MGSEIYPKVYENLRALFSSFIPIPLGGRISSSPSLGKDLTSNPEVFNTLGFFLQQL